MPAKPVHILAGHGGRPSGFAAMEITVPGPFAGPIPHAHDEFDEAIYVLSGRLLVVGDGEPQEAAPGSMFVAPRGHRHGFSNPSDEQARVLGLWAPPSRPWLSCGTSVPRLRPAPRQTRSACARFTPGTPAVSCPDTTAASLSADLAPPANTTYAADEDVYKSGEPPSVRGLISHSA